MSNSHFALIGTACALALSGCMTVPLDYVDKPAGGSGPTVKQLLSHIRCELGRSFEDPDQRKNYVAQVTLTLKVQDSDGASPSLSFITPYSGAGSPSFTKLLGATYSATGSRNFTTTFVVDLAKPLPTCDSSSDKFSLEGDLQLKAIVRNGLDANDPSNVDAPSDKAQPPLFVDMLLDNDKIRRAFVVHPADPGPKPPPKPSVATFGSQLEFAVIRSLNVGPTWSLKYFKGPSGGSGLLSAGRTNTDTLMVSFAPKSGKASFLLEKLTNLNLLLSKNESDQAKLTTDLQSLVRPKTRAQNAVKAQIAQLEREHGALTREVAELSREIAAAEQEDVAAAVAAAQAQTYLMLWQQLRPSATP